ncbi:hypothetical protein OCU04_000716 [Sclerotinia nivalis]|uniref:Uncharacterized protein n=1 Tax=Sclerotinia nivalis TaxID=352851 RepID=A0A9X0DNP5_9HELO|nr:hypothetical protein OCU04_000716 [Sclerotinia nivalis]
MAIQNCRGDTEIMPSLFDHLTTRLRRTTEEMRMGSHKLFIDIVKEESWIRAGTIWSGEDTDDHSFSIDREVMNHSRNRSPLIFKMLSAVCPWGREDEFMIGME